MKYTPSGSVEVRVTGDDEHLIVEVADTGVGIPESRRHLLFKEFNRFGAERTGIEGTGLGLAITHRLARLMGGHIGHRDNPGGGSVFWLELPAGAIDEPPPAIAACYPSAEESIRVLVADDSEVNRRITSAFLQHAGYRVVEAHDGRQAVLLAASQDFDVVLMDIRMMEMDGLEAGRRIRALNGPRGQVPIVAVTANAFVHHVEECRRAGMAEHLAKPFTQDELIAAVRRAVTHGPPKAGVGGAINDPDIMAQLTACTGRTGVQHLLESFAARIEAFLRQMDRKHASHDAIADAAHELAGTAGTLGFHRLASAARRFQAATGTAAAAELHAEAAVTLAELRRKQVRDKADIDCSC